MLRYRTHVRLPIDIPYTKKMGFLGGRLLHSRPPEPYSAPRARAAGKMGTKVIQSDDLVFFTPHTIHGCEMARSSVALVWLLLECAAAEYVPPRMVELETLLHTAEEWMLDFDDDEDGRLALAEMPPLLQQIREQSSMAGNQQATELLTAELLMGQADGDGDGHATVSELVDLLKRLKNFDGGHIDRQTANTAAGSPTPGAGWAKSHEERTRKKKRKRRKQAAKDEI